MNIQTSEIRQYERALLQIVRLLPPDRARQLVEYAQFLEAQILSEEFLREEEAGDVQADIARWDALLGTDSAQDLLETLAAEALSEHRAGTTKPLAFDDKTRIVPG